MSDKLSYSTTAMHTTAATLRNNLETTWEQHAQILQNSLLEPVTQLGSKVAGPFHDDLLAWQQRMQECYSALEELADTLETSADAMNSQDQSAGQDFRQGVV